MVDSNPEMKKILNSGADCLRIRMEADVFNSSCGAALFDETGETLRAFDVGESATALSAFVQFVRGRYGMGLASYWHRNLNRDAPGYRPLTSRETALVRRTLSRRPYGAWAFRSSREALETLDGLAVKIADGLDKQDKCDSDALDWLNCVSEVKRKILIYGLPSISEENMFFRICETADGNYAVIPVPCGKSKGEANALAVFTREGRERFEFYLLRSEWIAYEVPKYLLPVENRAQQTES